MGLVRPQAHERQNAEKQNHSRDTQPKHHIGISVDEADATMAIPYLREKSGAAHEPAKKGSRKGNSS